MRFIHIPNSKNQCLPESKPPTGMKKRVFDIKNGGKIFNELLRTSIELFETVSKAGRNMSSMTTPITLLANQNSVDIERAVEIGISTKTIEGKVVLESVGIADTGADIAVCDNRLRNILGREPLQDATVNIHGCTGTSNNKNKDKLRIVTREKELTVIETRQVPELGYSGPDSDTFNCQE